MKYTIKMMKELCEVSFKKQRCLSILNSKKHFICSRAVSLKVRPLQLNLMFLGLKLVKCRVGRLVKIILLTIE